MQNAERSTEKVNVQTFVRFRLSHGSVRGHGSPRVTARNCTPIVHLNDYLVTSNPNITFITNSLILAAFHSFRRQWKPSTLQWLTHLPSSSRKVTSSWDSSLRCFIISSCCRKTEEESVHFSMQHASYYSICQNMLSEQGSAKWNLMSLWTTLKFLWHIWIMH